MWNKIYLPILTVSIIVMSAVAYLTYAQLQSIGFAPPVIVASFNTYSSAFWGFLAVSAIVLLTVGNIILWKFRTSWALWTSLAFFVVFVLLRTFWFGKTLSDYENANYLPHSSTFVSYFLGVLLCAAAAAAVFFNHFLVLRMRDKIHGEPILSENQISPKAPENIDETVDSENLANSKDSLNGKV